MDISFFKYLGQVSSFHSILATRILETKGGGKMRLSHQMYACHQDLTEETFLKASPDAGSCCILYIDSSIEKKTTDVN